MHVRNSTSRYHLIIEALSLMSKNNVISKEKADRFIEEFKKKLVEHGEYIKENGVDPPEIAYWEWKENL